MQGLFPSNTYDYEFYKISPNDIARLIAVLVKRDGVLKKESFIDAYVSKLYGTRVYGKMCFTLLAGRSSAEEISREDILKNYIDAVNRYGILLLTLLFVLNPMRIKITFTYYKPTIYFATLRRPY